MLTGHSTSADRFSNRRLFMQIKESKVAKVAGLSAIITIAAVACKYVLKLIRVKREEE